MSDPYSAKPWLKHYDTHVPPNLTYPAKNYLEYFLDAVASVPDRVAVYYMGRGLTFRELDVLSNQFAHFLVKHGIEPGDTVGVHLPNIPAYYIAIMGTLKAGCVLSGVSPLLQPYELEYQLKDSEAKILLTLDMLFEKASPVIINTAVQVVVVAGIADFLPAAKRFLGRLLKKIPSASVFPISYLSVLS